jgi:hypothetical protein
MTIEEIKEIRATVLPTEREYFDAHSVEMVDTLLAEVEMLNDCKGCDAPRLLAVATEALEKIASWGEGEVGPHMDEPGSAEIARTALDRIKG